MSDLNEIAQWIAIVTLFVAFAIREWIIESGR
jgi:hypothetical protein